MNGQPISNPYFQLWFHPARILCYAVANTVIYQLIVEPTITFSKKNVRLPNEGATKPLQKTQATCLYVTCIRMYMTESSDVIHK